MPHERRRVYYSGSVQGVGFRATCRWLARGFEVAGFVRNLSDGRVELVAEGEAVEIDKFLHAVQDSMGEVIRGIQIHQEEPDQPVLTGFSVRS
jgi:acylphosphatase